METVSGGCGPSDGEHLPRLGRRIGLALLTFALVSEVAGPRAPVARRHDTEPYLSVPQGSYRGRVVELLTGQPISGVTVVILWEFINPQDGEQRNVFALREALTDATGAFSVDASSIETNPPPRAFPPRVLIYKPGYASFPHEVRYPVGEPATPFAGTGMTVRLRLLRTQEDRIEAFNAFVMSVNGLRMTSSGVSPHGVSLERTFQVINQEFRYFMETLKPGE